jgi:hypothetical protein
MRNIYDKSLVQWLLKRDLMVDKQKVRLTFARAKL